MSTSETQISAEKAQSFWDAIEQHLEATTPHKVLGVHEHASMQDIRRAHMAKRAGKLTQSHTPEGKAALEQFDTAFKALTGETESRIYTQWLNYKEHTSHNADVKQLPLKEEALQRLEQAAAAASRFAVKKPLVALGATALVGASIAYAVKATERIREKKETGETPQRSDRALQALGLASAAGVISAAALMWKTSSAARGQ